MLWEHRAKQVGEYAYDDSRVRVDSSIHRIPELGKVAPSPHECVPVCPVFRCLLPGGVACTLPVCDARPNLFPIARTSVPSPLTPEAFVASPRKALTLWVWGLSRTGPQFGVFQREAVRAFVSHARLCPRYNASLLRNLATEEDNTDQTLASSDDNEITPRKGG